MGDLERLIIDHAKWADRVRILRDTGKDAASQCWHGYPSEAPTPDILDEAAGTNCIEKVFHTCLRMNEEAMPYDGYSYEEVWEEAVASDEVCPACQEVRRLRSERMNAQRRLGAIRAAITRVGRRLQAEAEPHQGRGGGE